MRPSCRISIQEPNCYCNGTGEWNKNMLQCRKCKRYFHEKCVHCLPCPMLPGDKFYVFICSMCNSGAEFLGRLELKWVDIAHLILYNLTVINKKKYYDFNIDIMPYLTDNWLRLHLLGEASNSNTAERRRRLLEALQENNRFKNGKEVKKKRSLWALRSQIPPNGPHVIPTTRKEKGTTIWEFQVPERKSDIIFDGKNFHADITFIGIKKNNDTVVEEKKSSIKTSDTTKQQNISLQNGAKKSMTSKTKRSHWNGENTAIFDLLNTLIPVPPNYERSNHPFKSLNSDAKLRPPPSKRQKVLLQETPKKILNGNLKTFQTKTASQENGFHSRKFKIIGKRVTKNSKVQYLVDWKT